MTIIEKIRAEIEKLQDKHHSFRVDCYVKELLSFLDTLESEKPVPKDLEEAAEEYEKKHTYQRYDGGGLTPEYDATLAEAFIAGYKLHEANAPLPEDTVLFNKGVEEGKRLMMDEWLKDRDGCFWDGVEEGKKAMKEQMMKAAVEGWIDEDCIINLNNGTAIDLQPNPDKVPAFLFEYPQDVRVIVLPNTDKK